MNNLRKLLKAYISLSVRIYSHKFYDCQQFVSFQLLYNNSKLQCKLNVESNDSRGARQVRQVRRKKCMVIAEK